MTEVTVQYERKFSDGNYGSEGLSMSWTVDYDDSGNELAADAKLVAARCAHITSGLREAVLGELMKSNAYNVARAAERELSPPPPRQPVVAGAERSNELEDIPF